ncbi:kinesin-like protein KIN-14K [Salvia splendens]|uniref:kinesin-like protein KIN-14K n=1 Tax=Salvia splendens TaxID=180675 RepID=UPI001C27FAC2|nr:kinesin-like protein KIN-14K [Salvia splendens]
MDRNVKDSARLNSSSSSSRSDGFASVSSNNVKQQACLVEWINSVLPDLHFPANASDNELRDILIDGSVLCRIVNRIKPGSISERDSKSKVERFLSAMDEMGLPRFQVDDLEKGSVKMVLDCLWTLRMHFMMRFSRMDSMNSGWKSVGDRGGSANSTPKEERFRMLSSPPFGEDRRKFLPDTKSLHGMRNSPKMTASVISHSGHKFHEVFQLKQGSYADLPAAKISEMMKSNSLDNAPTQSLLSVVNGILDESMEMKSGAIPHSVVCLLRKVVQEIERRICTQAEHLRTQNNVFKAREEKYQSRIRVLEALATGTSEETQIVMNQLKQIKNDKNKFEEKKVAEEHETWKLVKEKDDLNQAVANLRQELREMNDMTSPINEKHNLNQEVASSGKDHSERSEFNQESEKTRQETRGIQEHEAMKTSELEDKLKETQSLLTESRSRMKELEAMRVEGGGTQQDLERKLMAAVKFSTELRSRVKELEAMDRGTQTAKQELEDRLKEAVSSLDESRSRVKELEAMKVEGGDTQEDFERKFVAAVKLSTELRSRVKELEAMNTEARTTKQKLEDRLKEAVSSLDESRSRVKELEAMRVDGGGTQQDFERKLMAAVKLSTELRSRVKELEAMNIEARTTKQELEDRLKEAVSSLDESRSRVKELEAMRVDGGGTQQDLERKLTAAVKLSTELRSRVKELEAMDTDARTTKQELEDRLKEAVSSLAESRSRVKELEAMRVEGGGTQQELESKLMEDVNLSTELRSQVKELEAMDTDARTTKQELEDKLKEAVSSLDESRSIVKELETMRVEGGGTQQEELERKLMEAVMLSTELRSRVKELEAMDTEARTIKKDLEDRMKEAVSSLDESRSRVKELEANKAKANSTQQELENRLKEAESSLTESRSKVKELEAMKSEAHSTQQELENRLKEAESSLTESRSEVKELQAMKAQGEAAQQDAGNKLKEAQVTLEEWRSRVKELEALSKSKSEWWKKKEQLHQIFTDSQLGALHILRFTYQSIQQEVEKTELYYSEALSDLGAKIKVLADAAKNYHPLLAENRKLHNELQELKGNIRAYCRIRPFLPGQKGKQSIIENIGENGELTVANPAKPGKEGRRSFRFDKVYGISSTQAQVFADTQPLIQSVLDGFNVCIFAYGQTGSGKTYTMTGPDGASEDEWGVNYRALKNLFTIAQDRGTIFQYEVSVQMVEIYNEQVRDLLSNDGQKKLGILTSSQPNGLAVPDASIQQVNTTEEVMKLMDIGLQNRAKSATAMNERSSRSHSIVSIHTRGTELKSGSSLRGSLHLVDLAGSERVDRSEVTGDRLKEAQHINKSLSALGDVVFALSQKSAHVPYRNSKLTQVLQSSLGGHAKTLMFVQLNPDATSFSETLSTLKFAERVSGVELGAAKSSRDSKEVRELTDQIATLKESLAKKDEELGALQKPLRDQKIGVSGERRGPRSMR